MKLPRDLSGHELVKVLVKHWNYEIVHTRGSHIIITTDEPEHQRLAIPAHKHLRIGTLNAILRTVASHKGVSREELLRHL